MTGLPRACCHCTCTCSHRFGCCASTPPGTCATRVVCETASCFFGFFRFGVLIELHVRKTRKVCAAAHARARVAARRRWGGGVQACLRVRCRCGRVARSHAAGCCVVRSPPPLSASLVLRSLWLSSAFRPRPLRHFTPSVPLPPARRAVAPWRCRHACCCSRTTPAPPAFSPTPPCPTPAPLHASGFVHVKASLPTPLRAAEWRPRLPHPLRS
jgi:hypothetical protein